MKKILFSLVILSISMNVSAQDYFIIDKPQKTDITATDQCCVLFTSKAADLVISTNKEDPSPQAQKNAKGLFEYKFIFTMNSRGDERNFTISKRGTIYRTSFKAVFAKGKQLSYSVSEVENYISLDPIGTIKDIYENNQSLSCIEFTTTLKDLKIQYDSSLPATLRKAKAQSGADLYVLDIDAKAFAVLFKDAQAKSDAYDSFNDSLYVKNILEPTDENDAKWEQLKKKKEDAEQKLAIAMEILVSVPGSQIISVPVDAKTIQRPTGKQSFSVTPKTEKEYVDRFFSQYGELIHQAESHKASRNYDIAQQFYENAAKAKDASDSDKAIAENAAAKMKELAVFKNETDIMADTLYQITKSNKRVNKQELFKLIDDIAVRYDALAKETGDASYKSEANRLRAEKDKIGTVLMGRFVMSEYKEGRLEEVAITNVRIYGSQESNCEAMDKPSYPHKGKLITTVTAADGRYNIRLKPGQYKTIIFEAVGNKDIKVNKHVSVEGTDKDRNIKIRFPKD